MARWSAGLIGVAALAGVAQANPFFLGRYSGLRGGPSDESAFSLYWNPAALARPGLRLGLHGQALSRVATYDRPAAANGVPEAMAGVNAGAARVSSTGVVPALAVAYGTDLGEDWTVGAGAGFFVPRAGIAAWELSPGADERHPGAVDGPQRWAAINTHMLILSPSVGVGLSYHPMGLSLGLAPTFNFATLSTLRARNADRTERLFDARGELAEGRILLEDATDFAVTLVAGARWEVNPDLSFVAAWHQGHDYNLEGPAYVTLGLAAESTVKARVPLNVADTVRVGSVVGATEWLGVRSYLEWSNWSVMKRQVVTNLRNGEPLLVMERDFEDTLAADLTLDFILNPRWRFHLGGRLETGATPVHTQEPGLAESDSWRVGVGLTTQLTELLSLSASYYWHQFLDVEVSDSVQRPTTNGHYTDRRQYLTVDLGVEL